MSSFQSHYSAAGKGKENCSGREREDDSAQRERGQLWGHSWLGHGSWDNLGPRTRCPQVSPGVLRCPEVSQVSQGVTSVLSVPRCPKCPEVSQGVLSVPSVQRCPEVSPGVLRCPQVSWFPAGDAPSLPGHSGVLGTSAHSWEQLEVVAEPPAGRGLREPRGCGGAQSGSAELKGPQSHSLLPLLGFDEFLCSPRGCVPKSASSQCYGIIPDQMGSGAAPLICPSLVAVVLKVSMKTAGLERME